MVRSLAAALLAGTLLIGMPAAVSGEADGALDYDIPSGHFYPQGASARFAAGTLGYTITDELGLPFWTSFERLGGVERLGYPISHRFLWHGLPSQATQKAVLQWTPETGRVELVSVLDFLADSGREEWLRREWSVPERASVCDLESPTFDGVLRWLTRQTEGALPFQYYYGTAPDALALYGLPTSPPRDLGDRVVVRFQKTALQMSKSSLAGASPGSVTTLDAGEAVRLAGLVPPEALQPAAAPPLLAERTLQDRPQASRGASEPVRGVATWYGNDFHGEPMRNGDPYNMYDPTTTASNAFPLGTWLRVINLDNGASVEVRVTDTGAFRYPIVVDLSMAAFERLDCLDKGVINVLVQPLRRE